MANHRNSDLGRDQEHFKEVNTNCCILLRMESPDDLDECTMSPGDCSTDAECNTQRAPKIDSKVRSTVAFA